ncbi:MAG: hypothetical protein HZA54_00085, partial [Planctomycetes bacterium]|nr:hypothetical protein [Planctomycetota bacterium]
MHAHPAPAPVQSGKILVVLALGAWAYGLGALGGICARPDAQAAEEGAAPAAAAPPAAAPAPQAQGAPAQDPIVELAACLSEGDSERRRAAVRAVRQF